MSRPTTEDLFWVKVKKTDNCWTWIAALDRRGYGVFQSRRAHRVAYELSVGSIPEGLVLDHICHNRACVNPDHLRPVTNKQNCENRGGIQKNTTSGIRGVSWRSQTQTWRVVVVDHGVFHQGGNFKDLKEAEAAAIALRNSLFTHNDLDRSSAPLEGAE